MLDGVADVEELPVLHQQEVVLVGQLLQRLAGFRRPVANLGGAFSQHEKLTSCYKVKNRLPISLSELRRWMSSCTNIVFLVNA
jgi:hypothetical protein